MAERNSPDDPRVQRRADELSEAERAAGVDDPEALADALLEDSDARAEDRTAAPDTVLEQRRSEDTVEPPDDGV